MTQLFDGMEVDVYLPEEEFIDFDNPLAENLTGSEVYEFGRQNSIDELRQSMTLSQNTTGRQFTVYVRRIGSPGGTISGKLWENGVLVETSGDVYDGDTLDTFWTELIFDLDTDISSGTVQVGVKSSTIDLNNYYEIKYSSSNPFSGGNLQYYDGSWHDVAGSDLVFTFLGPLTKLPRKDLMRIVIDNGKSDVDGKYVESYCELELNNKQGQYNRNRSDVGPFYGSLRINIEIFVKVVHDSITYDLFRGFIERIRPDVVFSDRSCYMKASDYFMNFKINEMVSFNKTGKTASELIDLVLDDINFPNAKRDIDASDTNILADVHWDDMGAMEALETIVEVGQHNHFVAGNGKYTFKSNQWLDDPTPDFSYANDDIDDLKTEYDIKSIYNSVRVWYPGDNWERKNDSESQGLYGKRVFKLENELTPDAGYAGSIATYILSAFKENPDGADMTIGNIYPDILEIEIGTIIESINTYAGINQLYTVYGMNRVINKVGEHNLELRCKKWQEPPNFKDSFWFRQTQANQGYEVDDTALDFARRLAQSFTMDRDGQLYEAYFKLYPEDADRKFYVELRAADGSGRPTGAVLATSNNTLCEADNLAEYVFYFPQGERPTLTDTIQYTVQLRPLTFIDHIVRYQLATNPFSGGRLSHYSSLLAAWVAHPLSDMWFKLKFYEA